MADFKEKLYVVGGFKDKEKRYGFLDYDYNSGYPYFSTYSSKKFTSTQDAIKHLSEASSSYVGIAEPKVYRIVYEEVDVSSLKQEFDSVDDLVSNLTSEQVSYLKSKLK